MSDDEAVDVFLQIVAQVARRLADEDETEKNNRESADVQPSVAHYSGT